MRSEVARYELTEKSGCCGHTSRKGQGRRTEPQEAGSSVEVHVSQVERATMPKLMPLGMTDLSPAHVPDRHKLASPAPVTPAGLAVQQVSASANGSQGLVEHVLTNNIRSQAPQPPPLP
jgi:hypothetical protein